jgi:Lipocalin-like domain
MKPALAILLLTSFLPVTSPSASLVGTWRLVSRETIVKGAPVQTDLGPNPIGYLIYDAGGHMAVQLMQPNRSAAQMAGCSDKITRGQNNTASLCGYSAYFGTYKVDERQHVVTHHLEGALLPEDVGKDVRRSIALEGDRLTITFATTFADAPATRRVVWQRVR